MKLFSTCIESDQTAGMCRLTSQEIYTPVAKVIITYVPEGSRRVCNRCLDYTIHLLVTVKPENKNYILTKLIQCIFLCKLLY